MRVDPVTSDEDPPSAARRVRRALFQKVEEPVAQVLHLAPRLRELREPGAYLRRERIHMSLRRQGYTVIRARHGRDLLMLAEQVDAAGVPGALVDCGVWNGGSTMLLSMGAPGREVWAFDSFEGVSDPGELDGELSQLFVGDCVGSEERLRQGFSDLEQSDRLHVVKGWFDQTLPATRDQVGAIAVLHVDADWYEPITLALETFYPLISPGGFVAVDDYRVWPGAKRAVDGFRSKHGVTAPLESSHFWRIHSHA